MSASLFAPQGIKLAWFLQFASHRESELQNVKMEKSIDI